MNQTDVIPAPVDQCEIHNSKEYTEPQGCWHRTALLFKIPEESRNLVWSCFISKPAKKAGSQELARKASWTYSPFQVPFIAHHPLQGAPSSQNTRWRGGSPQLSATESWGHLLCLIALPCCERWPVMSDDPTVHRRPAHLASWDALSFQENRKLCPWGTLSDSTR